MILLDTSVLVYAVGGDHPLRDPCRRLLEAHAQGAVQAATTIEVIQELIHVRARRRSRADAAALARHYAAALAMVSVEGADLDLGLALFEETPRLGAFDSVLAAVGVNRGVEALVSADHAFGAVHRLRWVDPAGAGLARLLGVGERELS